jgi:phospholipid N-methyltransferase
VLFARELVDNPGGIGAVWPSSRRLARSMAARVPRAGRGLVVELGAGTGIVTEALLDKGIDARRLLIVERSASFVAHLRQRFPQLTIVHGDAARLGAIVKGVPVDSIVSSLPLRSLPEAEAAAITGQWPDLLAPRGIIVQFSYDLRAMNRRRVPGFAELGSAIVWANLPPARVTQLQRPSAGAWAADA